MFGGGGDARWLALARVVDGLDFCETCDEALLTPGMAAQISTGQSRRRCHLPARTVRKGSDVLSEMLAEDSRETRIGLSAAAAKQPRRLQRCLDQR